MGQIVCTTFPRSASRFAKSVIETFYGPENYVEGFCKMRYLKLPNALTIIRKPEEAIPSWVSAVENYFEGFAGFTVENVVEESIKFYIEWMDITIKNYSTLYVATFENFTNNTQEELDKISVHFNLPKIKYDSSLVNVDFKHIPGGNPQTELSKSSINHKDFHKTIEAYNRVMNLINQNV